jgi:2-keto-4-pentenoate hydratase/2-oxohepta-3-ene-1,7-dioic acid hydratase in catechol pathway
MREKDMHIMRLGDPGSEMPVVVRDGVLHDASAVTSVIDGDFLAGGGLDRLAQALDAGRLRALDDPGDGSRARVGSPVARPVSIVCIGTNYAAHAAESGLPTPEHPVMFFKASNTLVGPYDDVRIPRNSVKTDWEVELAVVMGAQARYLDSPEDARACIAGYAISNDVSERDFQVTISGGQWSKGKSCETFNPLGPWLVPAAQVPDPQNLLLRSWVNGQPRQNSSTADMVFSVNHLIWSLSQFMVLEPGDIINTGTPEGVAFSGRFPYLTAGDVMALEIDGLGRMEQRCVSG